MNRNDVTIFALVTVMVVAVATAVTARFPGANFGSVADWFAAAGSIFAASSALYIADHEARRARKTLAEERDFALRREIEAAASYRAERLRTDLAVVQTCCRTLQNGLESFSSAATGLMGQDEKLRSTSAQAYLRGHRFKIPTSEFAMLSPSLAYTSEVSSYILSAKMAWGACVTRMELLAMTGLSNDKAAILLKYEDIVDTLRAGLALEWRLENDEISGDLPAAVDQKIRDRLIKLQPKQSKATAPIQG